MVPRAWRGRLRRWITRGQRQRIFGGLAVAEGARVAVTARGPVSAAVTVTARPARVVQRIGGLPVGRAGRRLRLVLAALEAGRGLAAVTPVRSWADCPQRQPVRHIPVPRDLPVCAVRAVCAVREFCVRAVGAVAAVHAAGRRDTRLHLVPGHDLWARLRRLARRGCHPGLGVPIRGLAIAWLPVGGTWSRVSAGRRRRVRQGLQLPAHWLRPGRLPPGLPPSRLLARRLQPRRLVPQRLRAWRLRAWQPGTRVTVLRGPAAPVRVREIALRQRS